MHVILATMLQILIMVLDLEYTFTVTLKLIEPNMVRLIFAQDLAL